MTAARHPGQG